MNSSINNSPGDVATAAATPPVLPQLPILPAVTGKLQPQKLELILNPDDGSLQTAPLLSVVMACTDSLYRDIYDMAHGELVQIIGGGASGAGGPSGPDGDSPADNNANNASKRKDKMSNLSFVNRRHELSYRLATHAKALTHVAALTVSNGDCTNKSENLTNYVNVSMNALTHARTAWIQNDECQDALYFFHGRLFSIRQGPHDIYGSLDFMCTTKSNNNNNNSSDDKNNKKDIVNSFWYDLPSDLKLEIDRYEISKEKRWSKNEVSERWSMAVRRKLLLGEVGYYNKNKNKNKMTNASSSQNQNQNQNKIQQPWKIILRGGIVRLIYGKPKTTIDNVTGETKTLYPLEAVLTVLTTDKEEKSDSTDDSEEIDEEQNEAQWTLISVDVYAQAKTGQSNHQLDPNNKQRYNLHRLCSLAMTKEELYIKNKNMKKKANAKLKKKEKKAMEMESLAMALPPKLRIPKLPSVVARPLNALFRVAQYFSLSWQLEILSEQAKSLAKGNWGNNQNQNQNNQNSNSSNSNSASGAYQGRSGPNINSSKSTTSNIVVTPVKFFDNRPNSKILGIMSISFWTVDDRYGPPSMSDLYNDDHDDHDDNDNEEEEEEKNSNSNNNKRSSSIPSSSSTASVAVPDADDSVSTVSRSVHNNPAVTNRLTLSIRAEIDVGIKVSLSGADSIVNHSNNNNNNTYNSYGSNSNHNHVRSTIQDLLEATSNPFALSASEALLAATLLCAERKCYAMVNALTSTSTTTTTQSSTTAQSGGGTTTRSSILPSWITLKVEKGSIIVAANIQYYTDAAGDTTGDDGNATTSDDDAKLSFSTSSTSSSKKPVVLFRLACDSRTGSFVPIFSRSTPLLQYMACNDVPRAASDTTLLRIATLAKNNKHRSSSSSSRNQAAIFNSGRIVRDSFESLCRSMNVLGQRTGVGIHSWKDSDENNSPSLRKRAIGLACKDVKVSLMTCCGMSVLYGLSIVSLNVAAGIDSSPEMSGGKLDPTKEIDIKMTTVDASDTNNKNKILLSSFLTAPPPSLLLDSKLVEHTSWTTDISGERIKNSIAEQERFGICCSIIDDDNDTGTENHKTNGRGGGLIVYGANIKVELEQSPSSIPIRKSINLVPFIIDGDDGEDDDDDKQKDGEKQQQEEHQEQGRPTKRVKTNTCDDDEGGGAGTTNAASSTAVIETRDLIDEVEYFASILADTIGI